MLTLTSWLILFCPALVCFPKIQNSRTMVTNCWRYTNCVFVVLRKIKGWFSIAPVKSKGTFGNFCIYCYPHARLLNRIITTTNVYQNAFPTNDRGLRTHEYTLINKHQIRLTNSFAIIKIITISLSCSFSLLVPLSPQTHTRETDREKDGHLCSRFHVQREKEIKDSPYCTFSFLSVYSFIYLLIFRIYHCCEPLLSRNWTFFSMFALLFIWIIQWQV